jgi:hypothetical protein
MTRSLLSTYVTIAAGSNLKLIGLLDQQDYVYSVRAATGTNLDGACISVVGR